MSTSQLCFSMVPPLKNQSHLQTSALRVVPGFCVSRHRPKSKNRSRTLQQRFLLLILLEDVCTGPKDWAHILLFKTFVSKFQKGVEYKQEKEFKRERGSGKAKLESTDEKREKLSKKKSNFLLSWTQIKS